MEPVLDDFNGNDPTTDTDQEPQTDTDRTDGEETNTTPSQSRSSSMRAPLVVAIGTEDEESVDLFDGYSFKGRHSVLIDGEEEEEEESSEAGSEEESLEGDGDDSSIVKPVESEVVPVVEATKAEEVVEPKTPEARPDALPEVVEEVIPEEPATLVEPVIAEEEEEIVEEFIVKIPEVEGSKSRLSKELPPLGPTELTAPVVPSKDVKGRITPPPSSKIAPRPQGPATRSRREKSGVHALDRYLSDAVDDTEAERDEEDDDWDFVEAVDGEDRNGTKGTSLFARGVVDRYRLAVFRKASTPNSRSIPRSFSGMSKASQASEATESPSPSQRRGRNGGGLTFRKHPRQFLRPRSPPPSSYSSKTSASFNALSAGSTNILTASPSGSTLPVSPSLKSKQSATSMGAQSASSDQSGSGASPAIPVDNGRPDVKESSSPSTTQEKLKTKKLKRYKNNAEKVFSLFSSPRQS
jgi:serum/glucocorticoid-regulated kinase 2